MNPFLFNKKLDLVDFDDLKLFMFRDDNLYNIAVAENRKNQSLADYQKLVNEKGFPASLVTPQNIGEVSKSRFGVYLFVNHLWENKIDFTVLDIGSHIGDFSLKIGNFIRTFGNKNRVIAFDPTEAGALVNYNIELNGLSEIVHHEDLAVADYDGLMLFTHTPGFSDSARLAKEEKTAAATSNSRLNNFLQKPLDEKISALQRAISGKLNPSTQAQNVPPSFDFIVRGVDILNYLKAHSIDNNLFLKIDIEGFDTIVIDRLLKLLPDRLISMIFEFTPTAYQSDEKALEYLQNLSNSFYLFDLYYSPNPTRFRIIESEKFTELLADVKQRKYAYTDIFALDKRTPDCEKIKKRLAELTETADEIVL
jgi:FkbM family methyltransferase